jgi:predicted metal-dependent phosphotriesterase family hydrolase
VVERGVATVETVRGPVEAERLGRTLPHEHIFILGQETLANFNHRWGEAWWDEERGVADAVAKLQRVRAAGIETLVDPTAVGLGRDIRRIQRVNEQVDLNIVVCTGVYAFMELPQFLRYRTSRRSQSCSSTSSRRGSTTPASRRRSSSAPSRSTASSATCRGSWPRLLPPRSRRARR